MRVLLMTSYAGLGFNNSPPIGLYRLQYALNRVGIPCDVIDLTIKSIDEYLLKVREGAYRVIGMSVSHTHMADDIEVLSRFREAGCSQKLLIIAGGQEATYNYELWLDAGIDVIFTGYAEKALAKAMIAIQDDFDIDFTKFQHIDGVILRYQGQIILNPVTPLTIDDFIYLTYEQVLNLDVPYETYWNIARRESNGLSFSNSVFVAETVRMYTSSHCPNHCGFCSSHRFLKFSQGYRAPIFMLDAQKVYDLVVHHVQRYGAKGFLFSDDEFLVDKDRVIAFCDRIINAKELGTIPLETAFNCQARVVDFLVTRSGVRTVNNELIGKLKECGFHSVGLGVESFSKRLLEAPSMNKRGYTEFDAFQVVDCMLQHELVPQVNIIIFIPETTREEIRYTMQRGMDIIKRGCTIAATPLLLTIPGAPVYGDNRYPWKSETMISPMTGKPVEIPEYFIPHDPEIARAAEKYPEVYTREVRTFEESKIWGSKKINKTFLGILTFVVVARLLEMNIEAEEWLGQLRELAKTPEQQR